MYTILFLWIWIGNFWYKFSWQNPKFWFGFGYYPWVPEFGVPNPRHSTYSRYIQFAPACRVVLKSDFHDQCQCKEYRSIDSVHHDSPKIHNLHHTRGHKMEGCIVMNHLAPLDGSEHCDKGYRNRYNLKIDQEVAVIFVLLNKSLWFWHMYLTLSFH